MTGYRLRSGLPVFFFLFFSSEPCRQKVGADCRAGQTDTYYLRIGAVKGEGKGKEGLWIGGRGFSLTDFTYV